MRGFDYMSASNKKKLRNELNAQKLTERQLQEQKEAKKLKLYTTVFVVVLALLVVIAAALGISKAISKGGVMEHNTVAVTIGEHELSNAELNYFYVDSIVNYYSQISQYAAMFGLDITKPLDEQVIDEETGETWADSFVTSAISDAKTIYAIADAAKAAGYELSESNLASIDNELMYAEFNALYSAGYPSMDSYLKAMYGNGATKEGYREYLVLRSLAGAYYNEYSQNLTYADSDLLEAEKENYNKYSSYTFNYKYILVSNYLEGGTTNESGSKTYSDDEKKAAFWDYMKDVEACMVTPEGKASYKKIKDSADKYFAITDDIIKKGATTDETASLEAQHRAFTEMAPAYQTVYDEVLGLMNVNVKKGDGVKETMAILKFVITAALVAIVVVAALVAVKIGRNIAKGIVNPLAALGERMETFAHGDLDSPFPENEYNDETG